MTNNESIRHEDRANGLTIRGRPAPYLSAVLPDDFGSRVEMLKDATGLTWTGFAQVLGVDRRQVLRWRKGTEPGGGAMRALFQLASWIDGGSDILGDNGLQMALWRD